MKVIEKKQISNLYNSDVKWYLFEETLWITKYSDYSDVEKSILKSKGSFNWLYEINDTVLFNNEGEFETAIINLVGKIKIGLFEKYTNIIKTGNKGNLFLTEKNNSNFKFVSPVIYDENEDVLFSFPVDFEKQKHSIVFIVDDLGFVIIGNQLEGWILRKASEHIYIAEKNNKEITPHILARYLNSLKLWEENEDATELKKMLEESKVWKGEFGQALEECIINLL